MTSPDTGSDRDRLSAGQRLILRWAGLGALSGFCATLSVFMPEWAGLFREKTVDLGSMHLLLNAVEVSISPFSLGPGLVFGLIVGYALRRRGLAGGWRYPAFAAASMLSYFTAVQVTLGYLVDAVDNLFAVGMIAGLFGAGLLTAATAALVPSFRRIRPCLSMITAGTVLGGLLFIVFVDRAFFGWLTLFAPWQAGFAAAMATAFDRQ